MRRVLILLYGSAVYALFLATFLYAIGFVMDVGVPKAIDDGEPTTLGLALATNVGLLGLFGLQHSVMARRGFKRWWTRIIPAETERSTFVLATCLILIALFIFWRPLPETVWRVEAPAARIAIEAFAWTGWGIVLISTFLIDHFALFGLRQSVLQLRGREMPSAPFQVRSLYRVVRHPLMLGFFIAFWSASHMTVGRLLFAGVATAWVLLSVRLEERDLVAEHGRDYEKYRERVPAYLPRLVRPVAPAVHPGEASY